MWLISYARYAPLACIANAKKGHPRKDVPLIAPDFGPSAFAAAGSMGLGRDHTTILLDQFEHRGAKRLAAGIDQPCDPLGMGLAPAEP
jgi:hypothetical protein